MDRGCGGEALSGRLEAAHDAREGRVPVAGHGIGGAWQARSVGAGLPLVTAQAAAATRGVSSGKSITGWATRLK